ncbi:MAG: tetratricopeptide repeat protein [Bacteroidota bacterium]
MHNIQLSLTAIKFVLVILQFFILPHSYSQANKDSLLMAVKTSTGEAKFKALKTLSIQFQQSDPVRSLEYARKENQLASELKNRSLEAEAMNDIGIILSMMQQNKQAIALLLESSRIYDSLSNRKGYAMVLTNLGIAWSQNGSFEKALKCYLDVIPFYQQNINKANLARVYMSLGLVYKQLNKYDLALSAGLQAKEIFAAEKNQRMLADISVNLGLTYTSLRRFPESEACFNEAMNYYSSSGNTFGMAVVSTNIAKMFKEKGDFSKAIEWFNKSLPLIRSINNAWAEASLFYDIANINITTGKWQDALTNLASSAHLNSLAGDQELQSQIYQSFYKVYDTLRQDRLALEYYKKYTNLHDTLLSLQKAKMIEELTIGFEITQKEAENLLLKKDIKTSRLRQGILAGTLAGGLILSVLIIILLVQKRKNLQLKKEQVEQEKRLKDIELEKIQVQAKLKEEELDKLQIEVQMKEQDLVYQTLQRIDLFQLNRSFQDKMNQFQNKIPNKKDQGDYIQALNDISREAGREPMADFEVMFKHLHKSFNENLLSRCSSLSRTELQVCALLRINLATKDIARLLNLSSSSVDMTRHRIRQKLELDQKQSLTSFLITL